MQVRTEIVVGRRTPEIGAQRITRFKHFDAFGLIRVEPAGRAVEHRLYPPCGQLINRNVFICFYPTGIGCEPGGRFRSGAYRQLLACHRITGRQQIGRLLEFISDIQVEIVLTPPRHVVTFERNGSCLLRGNRQLIHAPLRKHITFGPVDQFPLQVKAGQIGKEIFVIDFQHAFVHIAGGRPNRLVVITHFAHVRIRTTVGTDQSVAVEILVRGVVRIVVAAVGVKHIAPVVILAEALIDEIPDKPAL